MTQGRFAKPPLSLANQVDLLRRRGLLIPDPQAAEVVLLRLNYYRFSGYALHYEIHRNGERTHQFQPGTTFEQVVRLYAFNTELRALLFRYLEPVEIAFRTAVCYELAMCTNNPHWYLDESVYGPDFDYPRAYLEWKRECAHSREIFVKSYRAKYSDPPLPPAWMMTEILSLGCWSIMYSCLADRKAQKAVAQHFCIDAYYLRSWVHVLVVLRNLCAHHGRIWNRYFDIRPRRPADMKRTLPDNGRLAAQIQVLSRLLAPLGKAKDFEREWRDLQDAYPDVPRGPMGLPGNTCRGGRP